MIKAYLRTALCSKDSRPTNFLDRSAQKGKKNRNIPYTVSLVSWETQSQAVR